MSLTSGVEKQTYLDMKWVSNNPDWDVYISEVSRLSSEGSDDDRS